MSFLEERWNNGKIENVHCARDAYGAKNIINASQNATRIRSQIQRNKIMQTATKMLTFVQTERGMIQHKYESKATVLRLVTD